MLRSSKGAQDVRAGTGADVAVVPAPARTWPGRLVTVLASSTCSMPICTRGPRPGGKRAVALSYVRAATAWQPPGPGPPLPGTYALLCSVWHPECLHAVIRRASGAWVTITQRVPCRSRHSPSTLRGLPTLCASPTQQFHFASFVILATMRVRLTALALSGILPPQAAAV